MALTEQEIKALKPDVLSPAEIEAKAESLSVGKAGMNGITMFVLAIAAGLFIGCGATLFTLVQGDTELTFALKRLIGASCFSVGLMLVVVCGSELFTGNCLMVCGLGSKKISLKGMLKNWVIVYVGNFIGSILLAGIVCGSAMAAMNNGAVGEAMCSIAISKVTPDAFTLICKGIMCNFLVCLAVWMTFGARTLVDKIVACVMPITAFVACGFEHCVANMFFLFEGLFAKMCGYGANLPNISMLDLGPIFYNLGCATIGNIIGGSIMVGLLYWVAYARKKKH
ncbi:MAG: formate/nitrite transporter family protein [Anaerotardibacter sp.]